MPEARRFARPIHLDQGGSFTGTFTGAPTLSGTPTFSGNVTLSGSPAFTGKPRLTPTETTYTGATDAIDIALGDAFIIARSGGVNATTLAAPAAGDEGRIIWIRNGEAQANTVTVAGSGLGGSGASHDVITLGNVVASNCTLRAAGQKWYLVGQYNCTIA